MRLEEYLGSITGWPMWMRELLSKTQLNHKDRITIAGVLLGNLVPPIIAAEHVHAKLADGCARVSMRDTFVKVGTGNLKYTYWDVDDKQMQPLIYLGAASTEQGLLSDAHWGPALRLLQSAPPLFNEHLSWYVPSPPQPPPPPPPPPPPSTALTTAQRERCERSRQVALQKSRASKSADVINDAQRQRIEKMRLEAVKRREECSACHLLAEQPGFFDDVDGSKPKEAPHGIGTSPFKFPIKKRRLQVTALAL